MVPFRHMKGIYASSPFCLKFFGRGTKENFFSTGKNLQTTDKEIQSYFERERASTSVFEAFGTKRNTYLELHRYEPSTLTMERYRAWKRKNDEEFAIYNQRFIKERHEVLGNDLATAHFIVFRNGKVKFKGDNKWIQKLENEDEENCVDLPKKFVTHLYLEAVDASDTEIRYEGLENFIGLKYLKWLSFNNCKYIDDWCIDKLSGEFKDSLEYLDLSNCNNVTINSLSSFYRFKKLKKLLLKNIVNSKEFQFSCMLLEDAFPNLIVEDSGYESST